MHKLWNEISEHWAIGDNADDVAFIFDIPVKEVREIFDYQEKELEKYFEQQRERGTALKDEEYFVMMNK